jgi:hypothetical protein
MYLPTTNVLAFSTNGTERVRIDASGNVDVAGGDIGVATLVGRAYNTGLVASENPNLVNGSGFNSIPIQVGDIITFFNNQVRTVTNVTDTQLTVNAAWTISFAGVSASGKGGLGFDTNNVERMRITASGNVGIGLIPTSRNNTTLQIKDGIGFPATQVASADANTLDDYEEGTFSPSISYSGGSGDTAVVTQVGRYVKIGKWVTVSINVSWVESTASGNLSITNLPFTSVNVTNANFVGQAVALSGINGISGGMAGRISANSSTVQLYYGSTGVYTAVDNTHTVGGGGQFVIFTCAYEV